MGYHRDRNFAEKVHRVAMKHIYHRLGWRKVEEDAHIFDWIDINCGVDRVFKTDSDYMVLVQERFRDVRYSHYSDFTIRYRRDSNPHASRKLSEFYKIKADVLVYGIINQDKRSFREDTCKFMKYVVVNLRILSALIELGYIELRDFSRSYFDQKAGRLISGVRYNADDSSSFVIIDVKALIELSAHLNIRDRVIILVEGYE